MKKIMNVRTKQTTRVSDHVAKALVASGKFSYLTRELRPDAEVQPGVAEVSKNAGVEISPVTGKPKRQYRRRSAKPAGEEE